MYHLELSPDERESVFNMQFFLRVIHELGLINLPKNNKKSGSGRMQSQMVRDSSRDDMDNEESKDISYHSARDRSLEDGAIGMTIEQFDEHPEYYITDVNDLCDDAEGSKSSSLIGGYNRVELLNLD